VWLCLMLLQVRAPFPVMMPASQTPSTMPSMCGTCMTSQMTPQVRLEPTNSDGVFVCVSIYALCVCVGGGGECVCKGVDQ